MSPGFACVHGEAKRGETQVKEKYRNETEDRTVRYITNHCVDDRIMTFDAREHTQTHVSTH
jgi:hypothetical protein